MIRLSMLAGALAVACAVPPALAQDSAELKEIREQIRRMKDDYESRIRALEGRLLETERRAQSAAAAPTATAAQPSSAPPSSARASSSANAFNPAISLILGGTYARLSQDPADYRIQGFIPSGGEVGPGSRNFNLGESELTLSASIDTRFMGQMTIAVGQENQVSVEEAFVRTTGLGRGVNVMAGRFLSGVGYLNGQHAHTWDFVDAPLAYQAFFGGQSRNDGVQVKWLAPTETFVELGGETGRGASFPGTGRNKNGLVSSSAFARIGGDIGDSASWRAGLSWMRDRPVDRSYGDVDPTGSTLTNSFSGTATTWIADAIFKWAPDGNATRQNLKLQGEYFRRRETGTLTYNASAQSQQSQQAIGSAFRSVQSGYYVQGVYQFMPDWRVGLRYDRLTSGTPSIAAIDDGVLTASDFLRLMSYNPTRQTAMVDWSPSEFSRLRFQAARDQSRPGVTDNQFFVQYIMSLGAHGGHAF